MKIVYTAPINKKAVRAIIDAKLQAILCFAQFSDKVLNIFYKSGHGVKTESSQFNNNAHRFILVRFSIEMHMEICYNFSE